MDDLISRQAAIDALYHVDEYNGRSVEAIRNLPSAQPEIIRCKDCKHLVMRTLFGRSLGWCERLCDEFDKSLARGVELDDFCSRAEPKGEQK